jgi:hypothetical protein
MDFPSVLLAFIEATKDLNPDDFEPISYQGFDALHIRDIILEKAGNIQSAFKDICFIVGAVMIRGPVSLINGKGTSDKGKKLMNDLKRKYGIGLDKSKKDSITYSRILAAFPDVAYFLRKAYPDMFQDRFSSTSGCPNEFRFPSAPSIMTDKRQFETWKNWNSDFNKIINQGKLRDDKVDYGLLAFESKLFSQEERQRIQETSI